jgi:hypothetical protein
MDYAKSFQQVEDLSPGEVMTEMENPSSFIPHRDCAPLARFFDIVSVSLRIHWVFSSSTKLFNQKMAMRLENPVNFTDYP